MYCINILGCVVHCLLLTTFTMRKPIVLLCFLCCATAGLLQAQFGSFASAVQLTTDAGTNKTFYNTQKLTGDANAIGPNNLTGSLGSFAANDGRLKITGAEIKTFKGNNSNVCGARLQYRVYLSGTSGGAFNTIQLPFLAGCVANVFADGKGPCSGNDQKWQTVTANVDLTAGAVPGTYVLELYYDIAGATNSTSGCNETAYDSNLGNNYIATFDITPALPLQLLQFTGKRNASSNLLQWTTAQEENFSHFNVQRATDGIAFSTIGKVAGKGNSQLQMLYTFSDKTTAGKEHFYRLQMMDYDGSFSFSKVIRMAANGAQKNSISLLQNPVKHELTLQQLEPGQQVLIVDASGRLIHQQTTTSTQLRIPVHQWHAGVYHIKVVHPQGQSHIAFVKE